MTGLESVPSGNDAKSHSILLPKPVEQNASVIHFFEDVINKRLGLCFPQLKTIGKAGLEMLKPRVGKQKISGKLIPLSHCGVESCTVSIRLKGD